MFEFKKTTHHQKRRILLRVAVATFWLRNPGAKRPIWPMMVLRRLAQLVQPVLTARGGAVEDPVAVPGGAEEAQRTKANDTRFRDAVPPPPYKHRESPSRDPARTMLQEPEHGSLPPVFDGRFSMARDSNGGSSLLTAPTDQTVPIPTDHGCSRPPVHDSSRLAMCAAAR